MEPAITSTRDSFDLFFDAFDSFPTHYSPSEHHKENEGTATSFQEDSSKFLRNRRASSRVISSINERRCNMSHNFKEGESSDGRKTSTSTLSSVQNDAGSDLIQQPSSSRDEPWALVSEFGSQSLLVILSDLVIKAVFFQVNMLIKCSALPIWLAYNSLLFMVNPLGMLRGILDGMKMKILWVCKIVLDYLSPFVPEMLMKEQWIGQLAGRVVWSCFWSFYVGIVLFGLLITGFFCANLLMSRIVEKPLHMTRNINFDYTKASPDAFVQLMPCNGADCSLEFDEKSGFSKPVVGRAIPPNHKLHLTVSLTLPESEYNRNLGVFQVKVLFLSIHGKVTSGLSKPCMLRFKSTPIRVMETFIKSGPLLAGCFSESQVVDLVLSGITEGPEPTMCVKIILEQRAEYRPGAGIPEIYSASLQLKSELPLLKRIIWSWRRTLFIWSAMGFFIWEMLIVIVCCRPVLFPCRRRTADVSTTTPQHTIISNTT